MYLGWSADKIGVHTYSSFLFPSFLLKLQIFLVFFRFFIFWQASFTFTVYDTYLLSVIDICLFLNAFYFAMIRLPHITYLLRFGVSSLLLGTMFGLLSLLMSSNAERIVDLSFGVTYFSLPFFVWAYIPSFRDIVGFVQRLLRFSMVYFFLQSLVFSFYGRLLGINVSLGKFGPLFRPNTTFGGPTGAPFVISIIIASFLLVTKRELWKTNRIFIILACVGLFLTMSRAAWVWLLCFWLTMILLRRSKLTFARVLTIMLVSLAFMFAIARDNIFSEVIIARLPTGNEVTVISDSSRLSKLEAALDTFANAEAKDMLIGSGLGTGYVRSWFPVGTKPFYSKDFSSYGIRNHLFYLGAPHNSYMVLLNELGLIGTGLLLVLLAVLVKRTVIGLQREKMIVFVFQILMIVGLFLNTETLVFFASYSSIFGLLFWSAVVSKRDN